MACKRYVFFRHVLKAYENCKEHVTLKEYLTKSKLDSRCILHSVFSDFSLDKRTYELKEYDDFLVIYSYFNKCSQRSANRILRDRVKLS